MAIIKLNVSTNHVGSRVEDTIDTEKDWNVVWEELTFNEQYELAKDWVFQNIEWNYDVPE